MKTTIKKWGINAEGIGYLHHKPVFIKGALPDEVVSFTLEKEMPRYSIGHLQSNRHVRMPTSVMDVL